MLIFQLQGNEEAIAQHCVVATPYRLPPCSILKRNTIQIIANETFSGTAGHRPKRHRNNTGWVNNCWLNKAQVCRQNYKTKRLQCFLVLCLNSWPSHHFPPFPSVLSSLPSEAWSPHASLLPLFLMLGGLTRGWHRAWAEPVASCKPFLNQKCSSELAGPPSQAHPLLATGITGGRSSSPHYA